MQKKNISAKRSPTSVHIDPDILKEFKKACLDRGTTYSQGFDQALVSWMAAKSEIPQIVRSVGDQALYPEATRQWHQILEKVLSDKDERIGIEKNLEWAGAAVEARARSPRRKRSGG